MGKFLMLKTLANKAGKFYKGLIMPGIAAKARKISKHCQPHNKNIGNETRSKFFSR
jgi:hypothetical protein